MHESHKGSEHSRLKQDYWRKIFEGWQKSGESQKAYCERIGIKKTTFSYWLAKFSDKNKKPKKAFLKLAPTPLSNSEQENPIIIHLPSGIRLIIPVSISKDKLINFLEALEVNHA